MRGAAGDSRALSRHLRVTETATLDSHRWTGLWRRLGAEGDGQPVFSQIAEAYGQPARAYHTVEHLEDCLSQFDASPVTAVHPDEVEVALWFHDAVYVPGHSENEERSAEFARGALIQAGAPSATAARVASLVLSTRHHTTPREPDSALLCDIDLSILGRSAEVFDRYQQQIRREYGWVPEPVYRKTRSEILQRFLGRPSIYQTSYFRDLYELAARSNLARAIRDLA